MDDAFRRSQAMLELAWPSWRDRVHWSRRSVMGGLTHHQEPAYRGVGICAHLMAQSYECSGSGYDRRATSSIKALAARTMSPYRFA